MAIDFPVSPTVNDTHTVGTTTWTWDGVKWAISSSPAAATALAALTDVDLTTVPPISGDALVYNGSEWIATASVNFLDQLLDVDVSTTPPTNGQSLVYNSTSFLWEPQTVSGGGGGGLATTPSTNIAATKSTDTDYSLLFTSTKAQDIQWDPSGYQFFVLDRNAPSPTIDVYSVGTQWDVSTASFVTNTSIASNVFDPTAFTFGSSGTKLYVVDSNQGAIVEYDLSVAYDVTSSSYLQTSTYFGLSDFIWDSTGTVALFAFAAAYGSVARYTASTAWDVSTLSYTFGYDINIDPLTNGAVTGVDFIEADSTGTKLYLKQTGTFDILQIDLSAAYDTSLATLSTPTFKLYPHANIVTIYNGFTIDSTQNKLWAVTHLDGSYNYVVELNTDITNCETVTAPKTIFNGDVQIVGSMAGQGGASFDNFQSKTLAVQNSAQILSEGFLNFGNGSQVSFSYSPVSGFTTVFSSADEWTVTNNNFSTAYRFDQTNSDFYVTNMSRGGSLSTLSHLEYIDSTTVQYIRYQSPSVLSTSTTFTLPDNTHTTLQAMRTSLASADTLEWFSPATINETNVYTGTQVGSIVTLTDQATIAMDMSLGNNFTLDLGGNRLFDNPTNMNPGQVGSIFITQDATGSRTLSWGSYWLFPGGVAPTLSTTALAQDRIDYIVKSPTEIHAQFAGDFQ